MSDKKVVVFAALFSLLIIFGSLFFLPKTAGNGRRVQSVVYSANDREKPQAEVPKDSQNLGGLKVSDQKSADFTVKNGGNRPLQLLDIQSSCMCTVGQVIYRNKASEEFGMHSQSGLVAEVAPGEEAVIRVTYRPYLMPVYGAVEREVYVTTNDPLSPKLVLKVTANVS